MLGPLMIDIDGTALTPADRELLRHPLVGGVILFARNYVEPAQVRELTAAIHALREPRLVIAVDQEGGRVQRFRHGFSELPALARLGERYGLNAPAALALAADCAWLMASELRAVGVDFSFAPVLDLDYGASSVIGDRALHASALAAGALGAALVRGFFSTGMGAVGKHFPGHGYASADSHVAVPVDDRPLEEIMANDVAPYRPAIAAGLAGIMPAHVVYTEADREPAGYSKFWLQNVLRTQLGFEGVIFSDDLSMEGASTVGGTVERGLAALAAGCDAVLLCNTPEAADELLAGLAGKASPATRLERIRRAPLRSVDLGEQSYRAAVRDVTALT